MTEKPIYKGTRKRGDYFSFIGLATDKATKEPVTGLSNRLRCHGKYHQSSTVPLVEMKVTETDTPGKYLFEAGDTKNWMPGEIYFDIEYTDEDGKPTSTNTFYFLIETDVTI